MHRACPNSLSQEQRCVQLRDMQVPVTCDMHVWLQGTSDDAVGMALGRHGGMLTRVTV
jgi:hypothetical protein